MNNQQIMAHPRADETPTAEDYRIAAEALVASAAQHGYVLTIEQRPRKPLAMGNYESVVSVRPARKAA